LNPKFTTRRRSRATPPAERRSYFFLVVDFFVDFFEPLDFLAVVLFLAMALDLLSMPRM